MFNLWPENKILFYLIESTFCHLSVRKYSTAFAWGWGLSVFVALTSLAQQDLGLITSWDLKHAIGYAVLMLDGSIVLAAIVALSAELSRPGVLKVAFSSTLVRSCSSFALAPLVYGTLA